MTTMKRLTFVVSWIALIATVSSQSTPDRRSTISKWVASHDRQVVRELLELLSIPNVAADRPNIRRNAEHLRTMLAARGFAAEILETTGNPLVYGDLTTPGATRTLLFYAHYDGQPIDPKEWASPPWSPVVRNRTLERNGDVIPLPSSGPIDPQWRIYARSASDDKAPLSAISSALDALKAA